MSDKSRAVKGSTSNAQQGFDKLQAKAQRCTEIAVAISDKMHHLNTQDTEDMAYMLMALPDMILNDLHDMILPDLK